MAQKACDAAKACFLFTPSIFHIDETEEGIEDNADNRLDQLQDVVADTVVYGTGEMAQFFLFYPCFELMDGSYELIVFRNEYVKENPEQFGISKDVARKLSNPPPEAFATAMSALINELAYLCDFEDEVIMDMISINENGNEVPIRHSSSTRINPQTYDDYDEYGEYDECGDSDDDGVNKEEDS